MCSNKKCRYKFKTVEVVNEGWDYHKIVMNIKDMLKDVK